jgi:hypothetical protein
MYWPDFLAITLGIEPIDHFYLWLLNNSEEKDLSPRKKQLLRSQMIAWQVWQGGSDRAWQTGYSE